jgi:cell division protein FtsZ
MEIKPKLETFAKIKVIGVGGGGSSAVDRMYTSDTRGVEFFVVNTDAQALHTTKVKNRVHIGKSLTKGLGAGMNPDLGRQAAEEDQEEIKEMVKGADMVFVTCGLGGGTGSGASPVISKLSREEGALTIGVVTKPFSFEGYQRKEIAEKAYDELREKVDALITIPNDKLLQIIDKKTALLDAFSIVDDVLKQGVLGIADLIVTPGIVNVDFADVRAVMADAGSALMGIGQASGENRAAEAAKKAIESPLLELSVDGATGVLFNVYGGEDLSMMEIDEAAKVITQSVDPQAKIIFGAVRDKNLNNELKVTVVATGFSGAVKDVKKEEKPKKSANLFSQNFSYQTYVPSSQKPAVKQKQEADEELDIPAFIRRKLGKK